MKQSVLKFILAVKKFQLGIVGIFIVIACILFFFNLGKSFKEHWNSWLDIFLTISMIFLGAAIWYNEQREEWVKHLPKKLNIKYLLKVKDKYQLHCEINNAPLTSEGDIRAWGQSIGRTILNERTNIDFNGFKIDAPKINREKKELIYELTVYLQRPIEGIATSNENGATLFIFDDSGNFVK
jgi:hypothetical protein